MEAKSATNNLSSVDETRYRRCYALLAHMMCEKEQK